MPPPRLERPARPIDFRKDVEALRAIAVALVLIFHAGVTAVPAGFVGVDIFFVISGFLITGLLVRELESTGRIRLRDFYARRARRLLPAAVTVILFTGAVVAYLSPQSFRQTYGLDLASAAGYFANWRFAGRAVDYLGAEIPPSPAQHYWSLSVEEQFYLIWPLLLILVAWAIRRWSWRMHPALAIALGAVALPSLVWSVASTEANAQFAFFDTGTRMWELSLGGLVAIAAPLWARVRRRTAEGFVVVGAVLIVVSVVQFSSYTPWPGASALLPTVGTAMLIAAGSSTWDPLRLGSRAWSPLVWVGGLSYALYLWHWPLLVAARAIWDDVTVPLGLAVVAASIVPAWLTRRFIEDPIRFSKPLIARPARSLAYGAMLSLVGAGAGVLISVAGKSPEPVDINIAPAGERPAEQALHTIDWATPLGAAALWPDPATRWANQPAADGSLVFPAVEFTLSDRAPVPDADCSISGRGDPEPVYCATGDLGSERRMVVVGDSKARQWSSALDAYGTSRGWRIEFTSKVSCSFANGTLVFSGGPYEDCDEWNARVLANLLANPPEYVITSSIFGEVGSPGETDISRVTSDTGVAAYATRWAELKASGIDVIVLIDNPIPAPDIVECLENNLDNLAACNLPRASSIRRSSGDEMREAAAQSLGVSVIDFTDYFCGPDDCPAVIGNVVVYRGGYHLTDTYVRTLAPYLAWEMDQILGLVAAETK